MVEALEKTNIVTLRAFRAIDDRDGCEKYIEGHSRVLKSIGINQVTSSIPTWMENPEVFVFLVEDKNRVMGGGRIHRVGGDTHLPVEDAVGHMDSRIYSSVKSYDTDGKTGELCGLWNSREVAGMGFGAVFLSRAGVSLTDRIGIKSLFSLCASYTVSMGLKLGFEIEHDLGDDGTFYYPKLDLLATVLILKDSYKMPTAETEEREAVFSLRQNPSQIKKESFRNREIIIDYKLDFVNEKAL